MEAAGGLLSLAFGLVFGGVLAQLIGSSVANGSLERNGVVGLKTKVTKSSDQAWEAGHRAALPWLSVAGRVSYTAGLLTVVAMVVQLVTGVDSPAFLVVPAIGYVAFIVILAIATKRANEAGREATE